jgi:hypothetical protein
MILACGLGSRAHSQRLVYVVPLMPRMPVGKVAKPEIKALHREKLLSKLYLSVS